MTRSAFPPEKVGPKLRRHALLRAWEEIEREARKDFYSIALGLGLPPRPEAPYFWLGADAESVGR